MSNPITSVVDLETYAAKVFGDAERARQWLETSHHLLGDTPAYCANQPDGLKQVVALLLKIEHGLPV